MPTFTERLKNGWNAFVKNKDPSSMYGQLGSSMYYTRPDRTVLRYGNERSLLAAIYNRIALDVASISFEHIRTDENGRYLESIDSGLNNVLTLSANIDQTGTMFIHDLVISLFDEGYVAVVPVDTDSDPEKGSFDVETVRLGEILEWFPRHIRVRVYNDRTGLKEDLLLSKEAVGIIENPFYLVMNERSSTLQRLNRKLNLLDFIDEQNSSGKLDLIIGLPYVIKTEARKKQAEERRKEIEVQLSTSKYGIAYTDGTERITQLNRPVENNIMSQVEYYTNMLFSQLSITDEILKGTADEKTMLNYYNRTIDPIASAIVKELTRKFLTQNARTRRQTVFYVREPFKLTPVETLADVADAFTRNEILSPNEIRGIIGFKPSQDQRADQLLNRNLNHPEEAPITEAGVPSDEGPQEELPPEEDMSEEELEQALAELDDFDSQLDDMEDELDE